MSFFEKNKQGISFELAAFNAALTAVYGQEAGDIDAYQVPPTYEKTGFTPAPS